LNLIILADQGKYKLLMICTSKAVVFKDCKMKMTFDQVSKNIIFFADII